MTMHTDPDVTLVTAATLHAIAGSQFKYDNTVVATIDIENLARTTYLAFEHEGGLGDRNRCVIAYLEYLMGSYSRTHLVRDRGRYFNFIFQGEDCPVDLQSAGWEAKKNYHQICLLPDFYYTTNNGYRSFLPDDPKPWEERRPMFFWRGGTTGGWDNTVSTLDALPRYRLCQIGLKFGATADFGIYNVVQAKSEADKLDIAARLKRESLDRGFTPIESYVDYRFIIQIDGNANSWDIVKRFRLGCCMLMVDSDWIAWHNKGIRPWVHYVPVRQDMSDLEEMMVWCLENDSKANIIARKAREHAMNIDYDEEMLCAAAMIYDIAQPIG